MLTEEELIQIRRHLHQIPELALQEFDTHQYLVETIAGFNQAFLEVRTFKELPTALWCWFMVRIHNEQLVTEQTSMLYQLRNKQVYHTHQPIQE